MKTRWIIYFVFLLLVTVGSVLTSHPWHAQPPIKASWLATRYLARNTRISSEHLRKPAFPNPVAAWGLPDEKDLEGKYVTEDIGKDAEVSTSSLSDFPLIQAETNKALLFYSVKDLGTAGANLNAGAQVFVCETDAACDKGPYKVEAALGTSDTSAIAIRVPNAEADSLLKFKKPQIRIAALP
jgi:hypothetical protein